MASAFDRIKGFAKQADEKTKAARVTGAVAFHALSPGAGPVAQSYVAPPPTPAEHSQQAQLEQQKQYADWQQVRDEQQSSRIGNRPEQQPTDRQGQSAARPQRSSSTAPGQTDKSPGHQPVARERTESHPQKPSSKSSSRSNRPAER